MDRFPPDLLGNVRHVYRDACEAFERKVLVDFITASFDDGLTKGLWRSERQFAEFLDIEKNRKGRLFRGREDDLRAMSVHSLLGIADKLGYDSGEAACSVNKRFFVMRDVFTRMPTLTQHFRVGVDWNSDLAFSRVNSLIDHYGDIAADEDGSLESCQDWVVSEQRKDARVLEGDLHDAAAWMLCRKRLPGFVHLLCRRARHGGRTNFVDDVQRLSALRTACRVVWERLQKKNSRRPMNDQVLNQRFVRGVATELGPLQIESRAEVISIWHDYFGLNPQSLCDDELGVLIMQSSRLRPTALELLKQLPQDLE